MIYRGIIKQIKITNSNTDSYITLKIELDNNTNKDENIDINYLNNLKLKYIKLNIEEE